MSQLLRWRIAVLVSAAIAISYLDRQTLPVAVKAISVNIPLTNEQFSALQSAFLLAYAFMYAGGGKLADALGTRRAFSVIMIFWSLACASLALAANFNEFSDHQFEKKNYLNLAGSKLRSYALGPELVVDPQFESVPVQVAIERAGTMLWSKSFRTGEAAMCHSLQNIEHHHFKFEAHRRPGDLHVHFFGTDCLSFSEGIRLQDGDVMQVAFEGFGRPLRNPVHVAASKPDLVSAIPLG